LKTVLTIVGVPLFITLFLVSYLSGLQIAYGIKILIEVLLIVASYIELNEIEREGKDMFDRRAVLTKVLPFSRSLYGSFKDFYATIHRSKLLS